MATHKKYDLAVVTGFYTDPQSGLEKKRWQNIGIEMEADDGGRFILLDPLINLAAVPRGNGKDRVMVSKFEAKYNHQQSPMPPMPPMPQGQGDYYNQQQFQAPPQNNQAWSNNAPNPAHFNADGTPKTPQQIANGR